MEECYEPSALVSWVHERVPFVDIGFNNSGQDAEDMVDNLDQGAGSFYDYFLRAVVWGAIVTLLGSPLPVLVCVWHCCTVRLCSGSGSGGGRETSLWNKVAKTVCGALLVGLIFTTISVISVGLWAADQFTGRFSSNFNSVQSLLSNTSSSPTTDSGSGGTSSTSLSALSALEDSSDWVFVAGFMFLFLPLLVTVLGLIAATLCKHPLAIIIALIFLMVTSILLVPAIGVAVVFLILYSDVCVGLQYKQLNDLTLECLAELTDYTGALNTFCNDAFLSGVRMLVALGGVLVAYLCLQLSASCLATLYTGYRGSARIAPLIIDEEDAPIIIDEEDAPIIIDEGDAPIIIDEGENHELQPCASDHSSDPPPSYEDPAPETTDTATLLSSMVYEEPVSPTSEEVEDFLSSQPRHPQPTAPPLTAPAPTPAQTPDQPPVVEFGDDSTVV